MDHETAIVEPPLPAQRGTDDKDRQQFAAGGNEAIDLPGDRVQDRVLEQQIVDRIGREA